MAFKSTAFLSFLLMLACATFFFSFNTAPQPPKQSVDCFCDLARTRFWLKELLVDSAALDRSVANPSSASRLRRFFGKVLAREPVKVAVLGGSISAPPSDGRATYADLFFNWFLQRAPRPINGTHTIVNGAIPATGSSFFRYCFEQQIGSDADLVFVDFAANDVLGDVNSSGSHSSIVDNEEALLRHLMHLPSQPAIILVHFGWLREYHNAQESLNSLAAYYDIPAISYKNMLYAWLYEHPRKGDPLDVVNMAKGPIMKERLHPSSRGHAQLAWAVIHYFQSHVLRCDRDPQGTTTRTLEHVLPPALSAGLRDVAPACLSIQGVRPDLEPVSMDFDGWRLHTSGSKSYWQGFRPGSRISFLIDVVHANSTVYLYSLVAPYLSSQAACWLGRPNFKSQHRIGIRTQINALNDNPSPFLSTVAVGVKHSLGLVPNPAQLSVTCELMTGDDFRIIAILYG